MGCDIHALVEKKVNDHWVMVNRFKAGSVATERNYERFGALAGVRSSGAKAVGLPADLSDSGRLFAGEWAEDGHSHSYLELTVAARIYLSTAWKTTDYSQQFPCNNFFDIDDGKAAEHNYRLVFWFDN